MIRAALKNPHLVIVIVLMVAVIGSVCLLRIPADLLPAFRTPAVQIVTFYPGMPPEVMEQDIMSRLQRWTGQSAGIEHQEAKAMQGVCVVKDFFHPHVSPAEAISQVTMYAMSDMFYLPPGTIPPMVMPFDPTASVPLCLVTVSNPDMDDKELYDIAYKNLRNNLQSIPGVIAPAVNGGTLRRILAYVDPRRLKAYGLSILDVHRALRKQNVLIPAGSAKIRDREFYIYTNAIPDRVELLNDAPIVRRPDGTYVRFRDVGEVQDAHQIQTNIVRVNGRPLVYVPVYRQPGANTIEIVDRIHARLQEILARLKDERRLPDGSEDPKMRNLTLSVVMDQSVKVRESIFALWLAALLGAGFAGAIVLLFLRNWRSTFVVVLAIPTAILAAMIGLYFTSNTVNAMTLGGLALAVGILIDQSIVVIDNIERHMKLGGKGPLQCAWEGTREVAVPLLVSTLTFAVVFFPVLFLSGLARFLFAPLSLAVVFAVAASYLVAVFFVPVVAARTMRVEPEVVIPDDGESHVLVAADQESRIVSEIERVLVAQGALVRGYRVVLEWALRWRKTVVFASVVLFFGAVRLMGETGRELFPPIDAGQFTIYVRAPSGTRIEITESIVKRIENVIVDELGDPAPDNPTPESIYPATRRKFAGGEYRVLTPEEVRRARAASDCRMLISNIGVLMDWPAAYTPNTGPMDAFLLVQLAGRRGVSVFEYVARLRERLRREFPEVEFAFDTGGILTAALNMGEPSPIHLQIAGYTLEKAQHIARELVSEIRAVPGTTDVRIAQRIDYPMIKVEIDRLAAADRGLTPEEVMKALVSSTNSSVNFDPAFWIDPRNGNHYFLGTQYFERDIRSLDTLRDIPLRGRDERAPTIHLQDVARIVTNRQGPAVIHHRNITRVTDVYANVDPEYDIGGVMAAIEARLNDPQRRRLAETPVPLPVDPWRGKRIADLPLDALRQLAETPVEQWPGFEDPREQPRYRQFAARLHEYLRKPIVLRPVFDPRSAVARYPAWFRNLLDRTGLNRPTRFAVGGPDFKGFTVEIQGEVRAMRESFIDFTLGLALATVLVFLVMVGQFRSLIDPLIVMVTVPMGFIGVAAALYLTGTRLNIQSFMGVIMMIGIVVEYTIVLLDFAEQRLREGATVQQAITDAAIVRFRPILMTSLTTILALLPMAIGLAGAEADVPLARTIVGAVVAATILPKFVVPALYVLLKRPARATASEPGW